MANVWRRAPAGRITGRNLIKQQAGAVSQAIAAQFFEAPTGGGVVSGAFSVTIDPAALAATGKLAIAGSASQTIGAVTQSANGALPINGTFGQTLDVVTQNSTGTVIINGLLAQTVGPITQSAAGAVVIIQAQATTVRIRDRPMANPVEAISAGDAVAVTKSDTTAVLFHAVYVGGTGDLALRPVGGTAVTFSGVPAGTIIPLRCDRVMSTNTTATLIVGMKY